MANRFCTKKRKVDAYINVFEVKNLHDSSIYYSAIKRINNVRFTVSGKTAKAAALALDIKLIKSGLNPINILKQKV